MATIDETATTTPVTPALPTCPGCGSTRFSMEERVDRDTSTLYEIAPDEWKYVSGPMNVPTEDLFDILFGCDDCGLEVSDETLWDILASWPVPPELAATAI